MAVVAIKSAQITNRDTVPVILEDAKLANSEIRGAMGVVTFTNGDDIGSTYRMFSVPAKAIPKSLKITCVDVGASVDVGLYRTTKNGGAVVTAAFFSTAKSLDSVLSKSECLRDAVITVALSENRIKDHVGPLTYPNDQTFDVVLTATAAADITGAVMVEMDWMEG